MYHRIPKDGKMANWLHWQCRNVSMVSEVSYEFSVASKSTDSMQKASSLANCVVCPANLGVVAMRVEIR